jgi:hypothetical protein
VARPTSLAITADGIRIPGRRWDQSRLLAGAGAGGWGWGLVEGDEFGVDGLGVGVVEVGEDGQGVGPGCAGGVEVAGGVRGVAEAGEGGGFVVAVAEVAEQGAGVLVAVAGLGVVAEAVVGVAEADPVTGPGGQVQGPAEVGVGLAVGAIPPPASLSLPARTAIAAGSLRPTARAGPGRGCAAATWAGCSLPPRTLSVGVLPAARGLDGGQLECGNRPVGLRALDGIAEGQVVRVVRARDLVLPAFDR